MGDFLSSRVMVRFGSFELDNRVGELCREGIKIRLQEQPLQVLQILLEQPGRVVSREELQPEIWPSDTFVDFDHGINNAIKRACVWVVWEKLKVMSGEYVPARFRKRPFFSET